ncbi:MAG TPA: RNA polymerase sigma factor [Acidimicrobiales bacterium]|jgi:RNA polymerase sigma factor (sigma-70 family)|nr:RNA polymerase sigma factor [Acidimicrobiales bacterium]
MMPPSPSDAALIGGSLDDPELFAPIFDRHFAAVHRFLQRRIGVDGADSLAGETFRLAFERRATYRRDRPECLPWLYGIAGNLLRQERRGQARQGAALRRLGARVGLAPPPHDALAERVAAEQLRPALGAALGAMRPEERDVVLLVAWEELTYEEVAMALGIPVGTVRSRLHRARRRLRERLPSIGQEEVETRPTRDGRGPS